MTTAQARPTSLLRIVARWLVRLVIAALVLIVALAIFTQTRPFKNWLRDYIVDKANESITGRMSIDRIDGNLYRELKLSRVAVEMGHDTVISVVSVRAQYSFMALLGGVIQIDSVAVESLQVALEQSDDSVWNLMTLLPPDTVSPAEPDTEAEAFAFEVLVRDFQLRDASLEIIALDSTLPEGVRDFNLSLSARYAADGLSATLRHCRFRAENPAIEVQQLSFEVVSDTAATSISDLRVITAANRITAEATVYPQEFGRSSGWLAADSLDLSEFRDILPPLLAEPLPMIGLNAVLAQDTLSVSLWAERGSQRIDLSASAWPANSAIDTTYVRPLYYSLVAKVRGVDAGQWLGRDDLDLVLNGDFDLQGSGIEPETAYLSILGDLSQCWMKGHRIRTAELDIRYDRGDADGSMVVAGRFGRLAVSGNVDRILDTAVYLIGAEAYNLDLSRLGLGDTLVTDLNLAVDIEGRGITPESAAGKLELHIAPSRLLDYTVDTGLVRLAFDPVALRFDTLSLATSGVTVDASGSIGRTQAGSFTYLINVIDAARLAQVTGRPDLSGTGRIEGRISGTLDSATIESRFDINDLVFGDGRVTRITGDVGASYIDSSIAAEGWIGAEGIEAGGQVIDSLRVAGKYMGDRADAVLRVAHAEGLQGEVASRINLDSVITAVVTEIVLRYGDVRWAGGSDSAEIVVNDSLYAISNLVLSAPGEGSSMDQTIALNGTVDMAGESNVRATITGLLLGPLASLFELDLAGTLSAELGLVGSAEAPRVDGEVEITEGRYEQFVFERLSGDIVSDGARGTFALSLIPQVGQNLSIEGSVPLALSLTDSVAGTVSDSVIDIRIRSDSLSLDILKASGYVVEQAGGYLTCDLTVGNTIADPHISGLVGVHNGSVKIPRYGIDYEDIRSNLSFQPNQVVLDSLVIRQGKGSLRMSGQFVFDSGMVSGNITSSTMDLAARDFYLVRHRHYEVQLASDVNLRSSPGEAVYGGAVTVRRSSFYLPALIRETQPEALEQTALPLLVRATQKDTVVTAGGNGLQPNGKTITEDTASVLMQTLRGNLKVSIPKNTWIRSPDLKMELAGELEVIKEGPEFELFGQIRVVRGHYSLYGKRFNVKRGILIFQGGDFANPGLDVEAEYVFRTATREKKKLYLLVGGTAEIPEVKFRLDDVELPEGDAVAYILFGRSLDELTQGQRSSIAGGSESGSMAGRVAANLLAGQLSRALGNKLSLDVIEIKAEGDLHSAAVVIGKYLTPDLFVSYQRSFGSSSDNDLEPETVTLEYQLTKLIYLQLTEGDAEDAGFDVILKLQAE